LLVAGVILAAGNKVPNVDFAVLGFTVCDGDNSRQKNRIIVNPAAQTWRYHIEARILCQGPSHGRSRGQRPRDQWQGAQPAALTFPFSVLAFRAICRRRHQPRRPPLAKIRDCRPGEQGVNYLQFSLLFR
jgi:hypothetical protein